MRRQLIALGMLCGLLPGFVVHTHAAEAPAVSAASAVLMDAETGRVLYAHNEQEPRAIASTTKLMTALVAAEYLGGDLSETVEIKREWTGIEGTSLYLKPGETITLKTLLYGLLLHSGNDAAVALAGICGGEVETFVGWMNQRAQDLGMTVDQRPVEWAEVKAGTFVECGLCGTAAVISPVGEIDNKVYGADETVTFPAGYTEIGPVMKKLRETLTGIQSGAVEDKHNWVYTVA